MHSSIGMPNFGATDDGALMVECDRDEKAEVKGQRNSRREGYEHDGAYPEVLRGAQYHPVYLP